MIPGFEDYTHDLTEEELKVLIPLIIRGLERKTDKTKAITNLEMCTALDKGYGYKIHSSRMRKMIRYIRMTGKLLFVSAGHGYWIENDTEKFQKYVNSLHDRGTSIVVLAEALQKQIDLFR